MIANTLSGEKLKFWHHTSHYMEKNGEQIKAWYSTQCHSRGNFMKFSKWPVGHEHEFEGLPLRASVPR